MSSRQDTAISPVADLMADLGAGRMVVLVDEEDRENEGDLLIAAEFVTPEAINFMARYGRGLICLTLTEEKCRSLNLPLMVANNRSPLGTNFTVSIEAAEGVTTGISAADRARTVQVAIRADARPEDIVQPGHIFPLMAQNGGVLVRAGHTEAGCDLARLAGLAPAAVICEILKDNGEMARLPDLIEFAAHHKLRIGTITDLIQYRGRTESLVTRVADRDIDTAHGRMRLYVYSDRIGHETHLALVKGNPAPDREVLVRVHEPISLMDMLDVQGTGPFMELQRRARYDRARRLRRHRAPAPSGIRAGAARTRPLEPARDAHRPGDRAAQFRHGSADIEGPQGEKDAPHGPPPPHAQHGRVRAGSDGIPQPRR